jgi:glycosyltransferase involved in cell wall biosynthesis
MTSAISAVIPCYNRSTLLKRAIDSALAQTARASEVIVVDDGSTDDTRELCAGYGNQIEYVWQENAGASVARNTGAIRARSPWIAFLDSDDYWTPCHLSRMTNAIEQTDGQARFYFSDMQMGATSNDMTLWKATNFAPPDPIHLVNDGTNWTFLKRQPIMLQCSVFRKDAWIASGGLDPNFRLTHDPELFFRLSVGGKICAVSGVGCVQTDDDVSNFRLTTAVHPRAAAYWKEQIRLWRSVLHRCPGLSHRYRKIAQSSLASAHWRLFRLYWSRRNVGKSVWQLPMLGLASPRFTLSLLAYRRSDANHLVVLPEYN